MDSSDVEETAAGDSPARGYLVEIQVVRRKRTANTDAHVRPAVAAERGMEPNARPVRTAAHFAAVRARERLEIEGAAATPAIAA